MVVESFLILFFLSTMGLVAYIFNDKLLTNREPTNKKKPEVLHTSPAKVKEFYNQYNDDFLKVYGDVIQAFRTTDVSILLDYQIDSIGFEDGMKVIDAGCGICGPATYFASKKDIQIDAITISDEQFSKATENIQSKKLENKVTITCGDYHLLSEQFEKETYDIVYFLESFGHSNDHKKALESAWEVLKPGGIVYIKDLFRKIAVIDEHQAKIDETIETINKAYKYNVLDLYKVLHYARKMGYVVSALKTVDLRIEDFENLTISNEFQELTGIAKIDNWDEYIFPVDFFELKLYKPGYKLEHGIDKYFLQNLYYMQVHKKKEENL